MLGDSRKSYVKSSDCKIKSICKITSKIKLTICSGRLQEESPFPLARCFPSHLSRSSLDGMAPPPAAPKVAASNYQVQHKKAVYSEIPSVGFLESYMSEDERKLFIESMTQVEVKKDSIVMRQNDKGNNFYIVAKGQLEVKLSEGGGQGQHVRTLTAGSMCGELSIVEGTPRTATIAVSSDEATLLMSSKKSVDKTKLSERVAQKRKVFGAC